MNLVEKMHQQENEIAYVFHHNRAEAIQRKLDWSVG